MKEIELGTQIQDAIRKQEILRLSLKEVIDPYGQVADKRYIDEAKRVRLAMRVNRKIIKGLVGENKMH